MNSQKRPSISCKGNSDPLYDYKSSSKPKIKSIELNNMESDGNAPIFPFVSQAENTQLLPKYTAVLNRTSDYGVRMEDLNQLQQDLEKLLSTCVIRSRALAAEIESIDEVGEKREKKIKSYDKSPFKRRRIEEKTKSSKEAKNGIRMVTPKHYNLPVNNTVPEIPVKHEIPKIVAQFWLSVEPYCADVTKDDVAYLDKLIEECSQEVDVKIPEVGDHYATKWAEEIVPQDQNLNNVKAKSTSNNDVKRNGMNTVVDIFANPLTQRLLNTLIEEKIMPNLPDSSEKFKLEFPESHFNMLKSSAGPFPNICMELVEQGLLGIEDLSKSLPPEDEILLEIKKCQQELATVNKHNVEELKRLKDIVTKDQKRQEMKEAFEKIDKQDNGNLEQHFANETESNSR